MTLLCCSKIITLAWKVCMPVKCRDHVKILYLIFSCVEKVPTKLPDPGRLPLRCQVVLLAPPMTWRETALWQEREEVRERTGRNDSSKLLILKHPKIAQNEGKLPLKISG